MHMDTSADEAIARALGAEYYGAGDPDYAADAAYIDDSEDSDYGGGPRKKKRRAGGGGRGRGRGRPPGSGAVAAFRHDAAAMLGSAGDGGGPSDGDGDSDDGEGDDRTKSGRRRRKDVGKQRQAGRAWTPEEESLFLQAMETHGRDWKRGSELVGTRDHRAIASHAQKYFIKLCLAGKPLPVAVARTGLGYTLSGAMLDPYSAAARSYGFKPELLTRLNHQELQQALSGLDLDRLPVMYGGRLPDDQAPALPPPRSASVGGMLADERGKKLAKGVPGRKRRKGLTAAGGGSSDGDDDGVGDPVAAQDPNQAAAAAAVAAAVAAAAAAAGGGVQGITPAQLVAAAAAAAAQAQLAAAAGSLGLSGPATTSTANTPTAAGFGSFTALLSGAADGLGVAAAAPPVGAGGLAAALQGATTAGPLGSLSAALAPALAAAPPPPAAPLMVLPPPAVSAPVQTEYARNRPRRELAGQRAQMGVTSESLQLVKPQEFMGPPGSGAPRSQPYTVDMSTWALLAMDFHAHLSTYEVIGLLGGTWNPDTRQLVVIEAYACRRAQGSDAATSVELDPESQVEVQNMMEAKGQKCVGWYHSHPVFEPSPSQKDMDNQRNYQALFRCEKTRLEPFLGIIVGPYDVAMPQPNSIITTFMVQSYKGSLVPYSVRCQVHGYEVVPDGPLLAKLVGMLDTFRDDPGRVDFSELWRGYSYIMVDGSVDSVALTRLAKFRHSLSTYMREADPAAVRQVLDLLCGELQSRWGINLAAALAAANANEGLIPRPAAPAAVLDSSTADGGSVGGASEGPPAGGSMLGLLLEDGDAAAAPPPPAPGAVAEVLGLVDTDVAAASVATATTAADALMQQPVSTGGLFQAMLQDDDDDGDDDGDESAGTGISPAAAAAATAAAAAASVAAMGPGRGLLAQMEEAVQDEEPSGDVPFGLRGELEDRQQHSALPATATPATMGPIFDQAGCGYGHAVGGYEQHVGLYVEQQVEGRDAGQHLARGMETAG